MASKWIVEPNTRRIDLPDKEWIDVKDELTIGELNSAISASEKFVRLSGEPKGEPIRVVDPNVFGFERSYAYIVAWSASETKDGKKVPIPYTRDAFRALPVKLYRQIIEAVATHVAAMNEFAEKNGQSGAEELSDSSVSAAS